MRDHYCIDCGELLTRKEKVSVEEGYHTLSEMSFGPPKVVRTFFCCEKCDREYTLKEMKQLDM